mgnify:CR=1 FL=1
MTRFSEAYVDSLVLAGKIAKLDAKKTVLTRHLFAAFLLKEEYLANKIIVRLGILTDKTFRALIGRNAAAIERAIKTTVKIDDLRIKPILKEIVIESLVLARKYNSYYIGTEHLLVALFVKGKEIDFVRDIRKNLKLDLEQFEREVLTASSVPFGIIKQNKQVFFDSKDKPLPENVFEYGGESLLSKFTQDTIRFFAGSVSHPIKERPRYTRKVLENLLREKNKSVLIVGEEGVGKSTLVYDVAKRLERKDVPLFLQNKSILRVNIPSMVASSKLPGETEKNLMYVLNEAYKNNDVILYFDDFYSVVAPVTKGGMHMSSIIKSFLETNGVSIVATMNYTELESISDYDPQITRLFNVLEISEPNKRELKSIIRTYTDSLKERYTLAVTDETISSLISMCEEHLPNLCFPQKAIEIIDAILGKKIYKHDYKYKEIGALIRDLKEIEMGKDLLLASKKFDEIEDLINKQKSIADKIEILNAKRKSSFNDEITENDIRSLIATKTGLPIKTLSNDETSNLINLEKVIKESIVSQEEAVKKVSYAVKRGRIGIANKNRPWASFLFLGPTGVGKTELAKVLSQHLFGDGDKRLIQIDMSEFMEQHSVSKLIGSPPGYIGYDEGGYLTDQILKNPHSVVLFDEIEKAHINVLNILLQILEEGHLTSARGERVSFQNTIIILTSNIGADKIFEDKILGFYREDSKTNDANDEFIAYDEMKETLLKELKKKLNPELLNRLDDIIIFRSLTKKDARKILEILLKELEKRLKKINISIKLDSKAKKFILEKGFSKEYGARPLRRTVQSEIEDSIADYILENRSKYNKLGKHKSLNITYDKKLRRLVISS